MRIYIGFDDTDTTDSNRGAGKLTHWFGSEKSGQFFLDNLKFMADHENGV